MRSIGPRRPPLEAARAELAGRLQERRPEIEAAALTRICSISDSSEVAEAEYVEGLRSAISIALDYCFDGLKSTEGTSIPAALLAQARVAVRRRVSLENLLRRYFAGHSLFCDFIIEEIAQGSLLATAELKHLLRVQATRCDRLFAAASEEYEGERERMARSGEQRHVERITRLLDGELLDTSTIEYDFEGHHLGVVAKDPDAQGAIRGLASRLDHRLLTISRSDGAVWAWLGGRDKVEVDRLQRQVSLAWPPHISLATGEPGEGLGGWRLTHQQARAAFSIALHSDESLTRYADVALLASVLQDNLLATSLRELYLVPLERERDGGEALRGTLRAYFATERNISSAAIELGVSRRTVFNRVRAIEELVGRSIDSVGAELEAALRLHDLSDGSRGLGSARS